MQNVYAFVLSKALRKDVKPAAESGVWAKAAELVVIMAKAKVFVPQGPTHPPP